MIVDIKEGDYYFVGKKHLADGELLAVDGMSVLQWRKEPPTESGAYQAETKEEIFGMREVKFVDILVSADGRCDVEVTGHGSTFMPDHFYRWLGPIPMAEPPKDGLE